MIGARYGIASSPWARRCLVTFALAAFAPISPADAAPERALCVGHLHVVPGTVHLGAFFTIRGSAFTCQTPAGRLYPAAVILYKPHLGFKILTTAVGTDGTYAIRLRMPRSLMAATALSGGSSAAVAATPGLYYLTVRLSDVYLPPPAQALAHLRVIK